MHESSAPTPHRDPRSGDSSLLPIQIGSEHPKLSGHYFPIRKYTSHFGHRVVKRNSLPDTLGPELRSRAPRGGKVDPPTFAHIRRSTVQQKLARVSHMSITTFGKYPMTGRQVRLVPLFGGCQLVL